MRKVLTLAVLVASCGSEGVPATSTQNSPSTAVDVPDEFNGLDEAAPPVRFRPCTEATDCESDEQCVLGIGGDDFNVCAKPCGTVDDCEAALVTSDPERAEAITCSPLLGVSRCILGCATDDACDQGMSCLYGACVWR